MDRHPYSPRSFPRGAWCPRGFIRKVTYLEVIPNASFSTRGASSLFPLRRIPRFRFFHPSPSFFIVWSRKASPRRYGINCTSTSRTLERKCPRSPCREISKFFYRRMILCALSEARYKDSQRSECSSWKEGREIFEIVETI